MILRSLAFLAVVAPFAAVQALENEREFELEDLETGRDITERIKYSREGGEFDEWRLSIGSQPQLDRVQVQTQIANLSYPGPSRIETDRVNNDPKLPPMVELWWLLGDFEERDRGWVYGLALDYGYRGYEIFYGIGTLSEKINLHTLGAKIQYAYAWYPEQQLRMEVGPLIGFGAMWSEHDLINMDNGAPERTYGQGWYIQGGARGALVWHPGRSQAWQLGATLDYLTGYGYSGYRSEGSLGEVSSELRFWWSGFGASAFVGHRF